MNNAGIISCLDPWLDNLHLRCQILTDLQFSRGTALSHGQDRVILSPHGALESRRGGAFKRPKYPGLTCKRNLDSIRLKPRHCYCSKAPQVILSFSLGWGPLCCLVTHCWRIFFFFLDIEDQNIKLRPRKEWGGGEVYCFILVKYEMACSVAKVFWSQLKCQSNFMSITNSCWL